MTGGTSPTGFGVVMSNKATPLVAGLQKGQLVTGNGDAARIQLDAAGVEGQNGQQYRIPVGVACGAAANCTGTTLKAGDLSASFTLEFKYH
ncbi:hypothetical protein D3C79_942240 [compost metagenome]